MRLLGPVVDRFLFRPVKDAQDWQPAPQELHAQDVERALADRTPIHAWWCRPEEWEPQRGAVLYCHGNAGNLSHRALSVGRWLDQVGRAVLIFDYPGYGKSGGRPSEAGCYAAAQVMYDFLVKEKQVPPQRLILYGGSLGGSVAIELAARLPHGALVLVSAFTSVADMARRQFPWLPFPSRWVGARCDNLAKIRRCQAPIFIAHGTKDSIVPFSHGEQLYRATCQHCRFYPLEGYDHNHTPGPDFYQAVKEFIGPA